MLKKVVGEDGEIAGVSGVAWKPALYAAIVGVADAVEPCGIGHRQRAQKDALHQREDGRVGADAQSQCNDRRDGESWRLAQLAQGMAQVLKQLLHGSLHPHDSVLSALHVPYELVGVSADGQ